MRTLFLSFLALLPSWAKRVIYNAVFGYKIHHTAKIGISVILADRLVMGPGSRIGNLNFIKRARLVYIGVGSRVGDRNVIGGSPVGSEVRFRQDAKRRRDFVLEKEAAVTSGHHFDCTERIRVGAFSIIGGYSSQLLTHSVHIVSGEQRCSGIDISRYAFVGTRAIILPGATLARGTVVGAGSTVAGVMREKYCLISGVPAVVVRRYTGREVYFTRKRGMITNRD